METSQDIVALAHKIAEKAHRDQVRKFSGEPYIRHPERVKDIVASRGGNNSDMSAALLHDVLEDTDVSRSSLSVQGVPDDVIRLVDFLTRNFDENYAQFICRVSKNPRAIQIKLADLEDNMRDLSEGAQKDKYRLAHMYLSQQLQKKE
jgi:(p)ppGpp synthase/HD superfamily hydrolase